MKQPARNIDPVERLLVRVPERRFAELVGLVYNGLPGHADLLVKVIPATQPGSQRKKKPADIAPAGLNSLGEITLSVAFYRL